MNLITRSAIAVAVTAALGSNANALSQAEYATAVKVYFGGATATDNTLEEVLVSSVGGICDPNLGDIDVYRTTANQRVVTCRVSNENTPGHNFALRAAGGTLVAFHKESQGGSSNGVVPLINVASGQAHALRWLDVGALSNASCTSANLALPNLQPYVDHTNCSTSALTPVDTSGSATFDVHGGISDNEPAVAFPAPGDDANLLVSAPGIAIIFGIPVSTNLYRALQVAQYGNGATCATAPANDTPACVPSLTRSQIRALYTQSIFDWNQFRNASGVSLPDVAGVTAPTDDFVRICRRVASSGTQASYETHWLTQRCTTLGTIREFALPDDNSTVDDTIYSPSQFATGSLVNAAPSSGNVRTCMNAASVGNFWAIGVLSTEVTDGNFTNGTAGFRMAAIDGAAPTLANVANGDYEFFTENTINRIADGSPGALANNDPRREMVEVIQERLGNTAVLANLNATFDNRPWGNGGVLSLSTANTPNNAPYTDAEMATNPVNTMTKDGNSCMPAIKVKNTPVITTPNP